MDPLSLAAVVAVLLGDPLPAGVVQLQPPAATPAATPDLVARWSGSIAEAARRFVIPEAWIRAVIATESAGMPSAVSPKGAMGLMQLMPETWREMRGQYNLGDDAFDPRDNIMAGTAFLRAMYDRFGAPAVFAAYNAGPQAMRDVLSGSRPLPDESRDFMAKMSALLGLPGTNPGGLTQQMASARAPDTLFFTSAPGRHETAPAPSWRQLFAPLGLKTTGASNDR
jgi:hypothetical protein